MVTVAARAMAVGIGVLVHRTAVDRSRHISVGYVLREPASPSTSSGAHGPPQRSR
ncbi:hypothetical protein ACH4A8_29470 [Streptomyces vietnamensis]|uniref:hypothetical protein n=1 Tax=Streptomyces vietnamensis TaxID=362257 RepID=UPI0037AC2823